MIFLSFAINNYEQSPLRGCINDQINLSNKLKSINKDIDLRLFKNEEVTKEKVLFEISKAIKDNPDILWIMYSGHGTQVRDRNNDESDGYDEALYVYDGVITDDELNLLLKEVDFKCVVLLDSCFSGTATRSKRSFKAKNVEVGRKVRKRFMKNTS